MYQRRQSCDCDIVGVVAAVLLRCAKYNILSLLGLACANDPVNKLSDFMRDTANQPTNAK